MFSAVGPSASSPCSRCASARSFSPAALAAARVMLGDLLQRLVGVSRGELLQRRSRARVQLGAGAQEQPLVGDLLDQEVAEAVSQLGKEVLLLEQLELHQLVEVVLEVSS